MVYPPSPPKKKCKRKMLRGGSRTAATSKMKRFVIIVNGFQSLSIITKRYILDPPLMPVPLLMLP